MSHNIYLGYDDDRECLVDNHSDGGTYVIGGTDEAWLNVTYNYGRYYIRNLDKDAGIRWLDGKTGAQAIPRLEAAIKGVSAEIPLWANPFTVLESDFLRNRVKIADPADPASEGIWFTDETLSELPDCGYWAKTPHNAIRPLQTFLAWAQQHPHAIFECH